jgi:monoamine oxidase
LYNFAGEKTHELPPTSSAIPTARIETAVPILPIEVDTSRTTSFVTPTAIKPSELHEMKRLDLSDQYDAIIVGGGLSGLIAAYKLVTMTELGRVPKVLLVESSSRLGGRLESMSLPNTQEVLDLGAMWIPKEHLTMWRLVQDLGLEYYPNAQLGNSIYQHGASKPKTFHGSLYETFHRFGKMRTQSLFSKITKMSQGISEHHPFLFKNASNLDRTSVYSWVRKESWSKESAEALDLTVESIFGCKSSEISMLYFLYNIRTCDVDLSRLCQIAVGSQCWRLSGGIQSLTDRLAEKIQSAGVKVVLNSEVLSVVQQNDRDTSSSSDFTNVTIRTSLGEYMAKHVIYAASPMTTSMIEFLPSLPPIREQLPQKLHINRTIKAFAVYDMPFWRESGYSGQVFVYSSLYEKEPISFVYEATTMSGASSGTYVLCASIVGERATYWGGKTPNERRIAVLTKLASFFGPKALEAKYFVDQDWGKDRYARGGAFAVFPPGAMSACFGGVKQPHYRIHWAGTETANAWQGYLEGACQSGIRAAIEVADQLAHQIVVEQTPSIASTTTTSTIVPPTSVTTTASLAQVKDMQNTGVSNVPSIAPTVVALNQR